MVDVSFMLASLVIAVLFVQLCRIGKRPKDYPPGPPTVPILGNLHLMPQKNPHLQYQRWAMEYGPIFSLMLGSKTLVVLNKPQPIKDLIDKRGAVYGSRPDLYIGQTLISGGHRLLMMQYGPTLRMQRRLMHLALNPKKILTYLPYQELELRQLIYDTMMMPSNILEHIRRFSSSIVTSVTYGFRWKSFNDFALHEFFDIFHNFARLNTTGGAALADFFPVLRSMPAWLSPIKQEAIEHHKSELAVFMRYWVQAKEKILNKEMPPESCASGDVLEAQRQEGFNDDFAAYIAGTLFEAGSDTVSSELYGFIQGMLLYPDAQCAAQREIDRVVGDDRYPTLQDVPSLPYMRACIKETHRWMPTAILGAVPHATVKEDIYNGYHIPKGAGVMLNVWTIHRDPERYPDPERFQPERFLGDELNSFESAGLPDASLRDHFHFGAGRRLCPGIHLADRNMLLAMATIIWAFEIKSLKDVSGNDLLPKQDDFITSALVRPVKFDCQIVPRSEKRAQFVRQEWKKASQNLNAAGQYINNPIHG